MSLSPSYLLLLLLPPPLLLCCCLQFSSDDIVASSASAASSRLHYQHRCHQWTHCFLCCICCLLVVCCRPYCQNLQISQFSTSHQADCATQPQTMQSQAPQCSTQCTGLGDLSSHLRVRPALLKRDAPARKNIFNSGFGLWALALKVKLLQWLLPPLPSAESLYCLLCCICSCLS